MEWHNSHLFLLMYRHFPSNGKTRRPVLRLTKRPSQLHRLTIYRIWPK